MQFGTLRRAIAKHTNCFEWRSLVTRSLRPRLVHPSCALLPSVSVRHPLGSIGEAWELAEINVDRSKRVRRCSWKKFTQRHRDQRGVKQSVTLRPRPRSGGFVAQEFGSPFPREEFSELSLRRVGDAG